MANHVIAVPSPPPVVVAWACRRCGYAGGHAKTTMPLPPAWTEAMGRVMLDDLRRKLVRVHMKQGCIACPDDFVFSPYRPPGKDVLGKT